MKSASRKKQHRRAGGPAGRPAAAKLHPQVARDVDCTNYCGNCDQRLRVLVEASFEGIVVHNGDHVMETNAVAAALFGYEMAEMRGRAVVDFVDTASQALLRESMRSDFEQPCEVTGVKKDGTRIDVVLRGRSIERVGGATRVVSVRDITQAKEARVRAHALESRRLVNEDRARIAKDMHDELGADLTHIKLLGELIENDPDSPAAVVRHAHLVSEKTRQLSAKLDEIVWAANPEKDRMENLASYLGGYAERFVNAASLRCRLDVQPALPDVQLPAPVRYALFLAAKEALHNAVKHSQASEVGLSLSVKRGWLVIQVADNGCGFVRSAVARDRNGISSMKSRLRGIGGRCAIRSVRGRGTEVRLSLRLPVATF